MNGLKTRLEILSLILMMPALVLCACGILFVCFGVEAANQWLDGLMARSFFRLSLSPVVVLGGPMLAAILNGWRICHLSAEVIHDELVIALSIKRVFGSLICVALAGGLLLVLVTYAFVENFKIVAR
jgi:hypothetical protein